MADDDKIRISDFLENDGTIEGIVRQLETLIDVFDTFEKTLKGSSFSSWLKKLQEGTDSEKTAVSALTKVAENLISVHQRLIAVRSDSYQQLKNMEAIVKDEVRDKQREAEVNAKLEGSYARIKLELQQLTEKYKETNEVSKKVSYAKEIAEWSAKLMIANKELQLLTNNFSALTKEQKASYELMEKETAANNAAIAAVKKRAKAEAELNELTNNRGNVESAALSEQIAKVIKERVDLEAKELVLQDQYLAKEISSAELIKQRLNIKEQLLKTEAKLAALQEAANTRNEAGQSQLEEIKYNEELAASISKVAEARAKEAFAATSEYKEQIKAEQDLKQARLEAVAGMEQEAVTAENLGDKTYAQLDAMYKLLTMRIDGFTAAEITDEKAIRDTERALNAVADALEQYDKKAGRTSGRMSSRQREWNGLTNSIYQITRELPNLAVRADTFFLAISNNIPIFIDEFQRARKEIGSFGKTMRTVFASFTKGLFLAVPLLILSKWSEVRKVWDSLFNTMEDGTLKMGAFYRALESYASKVSSSIVKQVSSIRMLSMAWKKLDDIEQREEFLSRYREELEATGLAIRDVNSAERVFADNTDIIVEAYISRMKAAAAASLAEDNYKKAVEASFKAEATASKSIGKNINEAEIRRAFASQYGITNEAQIKSGQFQVTKETLRQIIRDLVNNIGTGLVNLKPGITEGLLEVSPTLAGIASGGLPKELYELVEQYNAANNTDKNLVTLTKRTAEWVAVVNESSKANFSYIKSARQRDEAMARGDQAIEAEVGYMKEYTDGVYNSGAALVDLRKKLDSFDLKSMKALNDSLTSLMGNAAYDRGGVKANMPTFKVEAGEIVQTDKKTTVKSSFDKSRFTANLGLQETLKQYDNDIRELQRLRTKANKDEKIQIDALIARYKEASINAVKSVADTLTQILLQENAAMAKLEADNIQLRLTAVSEGSQEEHSLRMQLIEANKQVEIAENAKLEKALRKSESEILAKYQRETEVAEREWTIKRNNWRRQQLESENALETNMTLAYYHRRREIAEIELQNELLENADLIANGLVKQEDIVAKHLQKVEQLWRDHRQAILSSQKDMYDLLAQLASPDSATQLAYQQQSVDQETELSVLPKEAELDTYNSKLADVEAKLSDLNNQLRKFGGVINEDTLALQQQILDLQAEQQELQGLADYTQEYIDKLKELGELKKKQLQADFNLKQQQTLNDTASANFYANNPQAGEQQSQLFELKLEEELLIVRRKNAEMLGESQETIALIDAQLNGILAKEKQLTGGMGAINRVAQHGLTGLIQLPKKDAEGNTQMADLSTDQYSAVNTAIDSVKSNLQELMQAYTDAAQAAYDAAQAQVEAAQTVYEAELQARANGYANDVEGAKKELELEKKKAKDKEAQLKKAQKAQEAINTAMQVSNLITGTSQILAAFAEVPVVAGILIATMWGMFALAKIKASQVADSSSAYGEGGYELAVGGSHASGHDIKTGIHTRSGKHMVIEGGEGVGIFSRKAVAQYGDMIPSFVDDINHGRFSAFNGSDITENDALLRADYARQVMAAQPAGTNIDLTVIEGMLYAIVKNKNGNQPVVLSDGSIMERVGNTVRITKRS